MTDLFHYEPCPKLVGVVHDGCNYLAHRICTKCGWIDAEDRCPINAGVLVPVALDREAARAKYRSLLFSPDTPLDNDILVASDEQADAIVDAALGVGEETP